MTDLTTFHATCYENESTDFWHGWKEGDRLVKVGELDVEAVGPMDALELVFYLGNKQAVNWETFWPPNHRSMSIGDVVVLDHEVAYACDRVGWKEIVLTAKEIVS
jgi:hypothetical protein